MINLAQKLTEGTFRPRELPLAYSGFGSVNWSSYDSYFEFVFAQGQVCSVHPILAEFLSPKVSRMRRSDFCVHRYVFNDGCDYVCRAFEGLVSCLLDGQAPVVDRATFEGLVRVLCELENNELLSLIISMVDISCLDVENALSILKLPGVAARIPELVVFVASHFYDIPNDLIKEMDVSTAALLLSHPSLKVHDEDSVYKFVRARCAKDASFASLFEFVYFEYLSKEMIEDFVSFISEQLLDCLNSAIWSRICCRLVLTSPLQGKPRPPQLDITKLPSKKFIAHDSNLLDGIIAHLTRKCGGNVHENKVVEVTTSSTENDGSEFHPWSIADLGTYERSRSEDKPGQWICYDFKEKRVALSSYTIRTWDSEENSCHLKSWVLEASNEIDPAEESWVVLDTQNENGDLNDYLAVHNYTIETQTQQAFRFIRLKQTGTSHYGNHRMTISALELFGTLYGD